MPPPRPRLPPLPHSSKWATYFPPRYLPLSPDKNTVRKSVGRTLLADPSLADRFVRSIPIRPGEVVIEGYAGVGGVTRSLLNGGTEALEVASWASSSPYTGAEIQEEKSSSKKVKSKKGFPIWADDMPRPSPRELSNGSQTLTENGDKAQESEGSASGQHTTTPSEPQPCPRVVVASEGSIELLSRGFDYPVSAAAPVLSSNSTFQPPTVVVQSQHDPNLLLSHSSTYVWPTLPAILAHELVSAHLPIHDPTAQGAEITKRPWEADAPPITVVCQVPDSSIGEQMIAQWVGSAVGDPGQQRTWMWEWGRIRMALLCGRSLYDRLTARPGEIIHCKLSILAQALFDLTPLPPLHHVQNVDKQSKTLEDRPRKFASTVPKSTAPLIRMPEDFVSAPTDPDSPFAEQIDVDASSSSSASASAAPAGSEGRWKARTLTYMDDFWPHHSGSPLTRTVGNRSQIKQNPLNRPPLLGIMLTPKKDSPILASQKDAWDYVMRRLFVRDTLTLAEAITNISFGAESLLPRIEDTGDEFRGLPVDRRRVVRELEVEEWARIVDVFDQWAFKPDNLILDSGMGDDTHRELGRD